MIFNIFISNILIIYGKWPLLIRSIFNQSLMSSQGKYEHDFAEYERYTRGPNLHPGVDLHSGVFLRMTGMKLNLYNSLLGSVHLNLCLDILLVDLLNL